MKSELLRLQIFKSPNEACHSNFLIVRQRTKGVQYSNILWKSFVLVPSLSNRGLQWHTKILDNICHMFKDLRQSVFSKTLRILSTEHKKILR